MITNIFQLGSTSLQNASIPPENTGNLTYSNHYTLTTDYISTIQEHIQQQFACIKMINKSLGKEQRSLGNLLKQIQQLPGVEAAWGWKQEGYISRFFSSENWNEWMSRRTALGKVIDHFQNHPTRPLDKNLLERADIEARQILQSLSPKSTLSMSCPISLASGAFVSMVTKNPVPLFISLQGCIPSADAAKLIKKPLKKFLDDLQLGNSKTINDGLKEAFKDLAEQDLEDESIVEKLIDILYTMISIADDPLIWALEELNEEIIKIGANKGKELIEALENLRERSFKKASAHQELGQIKAEISELNSLKQSLEESIPEADAYIDRNEELLMQAAVLLDPQTTFDNFRERYKELEAEIKTRIDNIGKAEAGIVELNQRIGEGWSLLTQKKEKTGTAECVMLMGNQKIPERQDSIEDKQLKAQTMKVQAKVHQATEEARTSLGKVREALQIERQLKAEAEEKMQKLMDSVKNGSGQSFKKTYEELEQIVGATKERRNAFKTLLDSVNWRLKELSIQATSLKDEL